MKSLAERQDSSLRRKMLMELISKIESGDFNEDILSLFREILPEDSDNKASNHMPRLEYIDPRQRDTRNYGYRQQSDVYLPWQNTM